MRRRGPCCSAIKLIKIIAAKVERNKFRFDEARHKDNRKGRAWNIEYSEFFLNHYRRYQITNYREGLGVSFLMNDFFLRPPRERPIWLAFVHPSITYTPKTTTSHSMRCKFQLWLFMSSAKWISNVAFVTILSSSIQSVSGKAIAAIYFVSIVCKHNSKCG